MTNPAELRLFANEWRNIAHAAKTTLAAMMERDIGGAVICALVVEQAIAAASMLEERALHLEDLVARSEH